MLIGGDKINEQAERVRATIEAQSLEDNDLGEVADVLVIVAIDYGEVQGGEAESGTLFYRCSSARPHVQMGLIEYGRRAINQALDNSPDDDA